MDADDWIRGDQDEQVPVRRRLIDEVIATGVPAVSAASAGRGGLWPALLYFLVPVMALVVLYGLRAPAQSETNAGGEGAAAVRRTGGSAIAVGAQNIMFDTDVITLKAGAEAVIHFENRDVSSVRHNVAVYTDESAAEAIFQGEIISGGTSIDYEFEMPDKGEYFFRCDVHPGMNGTVVVE
jgi:plastocyanin